MSHIDDLITQHCPDGVRFEVIGRIAEVTSGATPSKTVSAYWKNGTIPWLSSGEVNKGTILEANTLISQAGYESCSTKMMPAGSVVIALAGQGKTRGMVARTRLNCCTNQSLATIVPEKCLDSDFLFYYLRTQYGKLRDVSSGDGTRGGLNLAMIRSYRIPVPPLEVQREIVRILDQFTALEAELEAELEARRRQYEHYFRRSLSFMPGEAEEFTLGDIGRVAMCKRIFKNETSETGEIPFFKIGTFGGEPDAYISRELFDAYREKYSFPKPGEVLISAAGTIGRTVTYNGEPAYFQDSNIVWLDHDESIVSNAYLKHWYRMVSWETDGGTIKRLYNANLLRETILVPPRPVQARIVETLNQFDALVNDISIGLPAELAARRKQYEYYRDQLLTFEEAV